MSEEMSALAPDLETATLVSGNHVTFVELKTRQFFKLLKIITFGASPALQDPTLLQIGKGTDPKEWGQKLLALIFLAIPNAEDATIDFLRSMVRPKDLIDPKDRPTPLSDGDEAANEKLWVDLYRELANPEIEDTVTIMEGVIRREAKDLVALGRRIGSMVKIAQKTGQLSGLKTEAPSQTKTENSTNSVTSMDDLARKLATEDQSSPIPQPSPDQNSLGVSVAPST